MAIAGIAVHTANETAEAVRERLNASSFIVEVQDTGVPGVLAAVLDCGAECMEEALTVISGWDDVLSVGLVSLNYEEEAEEGPIPCPEHKPRKHTQPYASICTPVEPGEER